MDHLEAQSYIMPFIEGKLPESKQLEFVMHMKNCNSCHDELEIYYTLMTGMQILSDGTVPSGNFSKDLEMKLNRIEHRAKGRRSIRVSAFTMVTVAIALFMILFYGRCLTWVYSFEQSTKRTAQGEYYFARALGPCLLETEDRVMKSEEILEKQEESGQRSEMFDKIHGYRELEEYAKELLVLGGRITHEQTSAD